MHVRAANLPNTTYAVSATEIYFSYLQTRLSTFSLKLQRNIVDIV